MRFWRRLFRAHARPSPSPTRIRPRLESLESRLVPYVTTGNAWPYPGLITLSFVPDGTILGSNGSGYIYSNLFATFNARWSQSTWQKQILKAAATWAQATNVNIAVVPDDGAPLGSGLYQQGDPGFGDIRIGGFNMNSTVLAMADMPPPVNNYSIAGDIDINTGQTYNIGATYDLNSVMLHELGHSLGLGESGAGLAVMYPYYSNVKYGLNSDDTAGIRAIYSGGAARSPDAYDAAASNNTITTASDITSQINPVTLTALLTNLDITSLNSSTGAQTTTDVDYYTFTAPALTGNTLTVEVQSAGLSLLSPNLTVYAADQQTVLGSASGAGQYGTTVTVTVANVTPGERFYVKVAGAETTALGSGQYALAMTMGLLPLPTVPLPVTLTLNGIPISAGGAMPQQGDPDSGPGNGQGDALPAAPPNSSVPVVLPALSTYSVPAGQPIFISPINPSGPAPLASALAPFLFVSQGPANSLETPHLVPAGNAPELNQPADEDPPPSRPEAVPPAAAEPVSSPPEMARWQRVCEVCFEQTEEVSSPVVLLGDDGAVSTREEESGAVGNSEAGAAVLALALGGYWGAPPEEAEEAKSRGLSPQS